MKLDVCEWCGQQYPEMMEDYYTVVVFTTRHMICRDCYEHLRLKARKGNIKNKYLVLKSE